MGLDHVDAGITPFSNDRSWNPFEDLSCNEGISASVRCCTWFNRINDAIPSIVAEIVIRDKSPFRTGKHEGLWIEWVWSN